MYRMYQGTAGSTSPTQPSMELYRQGSSYNLLEGQSVMSKQSRSNYRLPKNLEIKIKDAPNFEKSKDKNKCDDTKLSENSQASDGHGQEDHDEMSLTPAQNGNNCHDLNNQNSSSRNDFNLEKNGFHKISQYIGNDKEATKNTYTLQCNTSQESGKPLSNYEKINDENDAGKEIYDTCMSQNEKVLNSRGIMKNESHSGSYDDEYEQASTPSTVINMNREHTMTVIMDTQDSNENNNTCINNNETRNVGNSQCEQEMEDDSSEFFQQNNFLLEQYSDSDREEIGRANFSTPADLQFLDITRPLDHLTDLHERKYAVLPSIGGIKNLHHDEENLMHLNQLDYTRDHIEEEADFFSDYRTNTSLVKMTPKNNPLPPIKQGNKKIARESEL